MTEVGQAKTNISTLELVSEQLSQTADTSHSKTLTTTKFGGEWQKSPIKDLGPQRIETYPIWFIPSTVKQSNVDVAPGFTVQHNLAGDKETISSVYDFGPFEITKTSNQFDQIDVVFRWSMVATSDNLVVLEHTHFEFNMDDWFATTLEPYTQVIRGTNSIFFTAILKGIRSALPATSPTVVLRTKITYDRQYAVYFAVQCAMYLLLKKLNTTVRITPQ